MSDKSQRRVGHSKDLEGAQRTLSSLDAGKSGVLPPHLQSTAKREDPITDFNKQPRRWLHVDRQGNASYVTVSWPDWTNNTS